MSMSHPHLSGQEGHVTLYLPLWGGGVGGFDPVQFVLVPSEDQWRLCSASANQRL